MALVVYDRVQQTGSANTTVSFTLSGSVAGYQSFAVVGNGNTTFYAATDAGGNWEVGIGTYSTTGPTLTRTTILSSSSSGTAVSTFSGTVNVFVTYPSEKSVNLDASGNVTALGTITSGVWNGTTIPVAYGGTGVTASTGANSVVLRDSNANITANNLFLGFTSTVTAAGTTTLTASSTQYQRFTGTTTQTVKLPDATTLSKGFIFTVDNDSTGTLTVVDNASTTLDTIVSGSIDYWTLLDNSTSAGTWIAYSLLPSSYDFNNTSASFGNAAIINSTWNGSTIGVTYGGTGLNSISTSNYAIYSSAANTLTAGTLPVLAGGTGVTTSTGTGSVVLNTSPALVTPNIGAATATSLAVTAVSITSAPTSNLSIGGALGFSDTGIIAHATASTNSYLQQVIQNQSSGTQSSAEFIAYNNNGTASTNFATVGINSSGYTGVGSINGPGNAYFLSGSTDLVLGTIGANNIRVVTNSQATDAMTINGSNAVGFNGTYGTAGQVLTSSGSTAAPIWSSPTTGGGTITTTDFTATAGQTAFSVVYTVGLVSVFRNGVKLAQADYTATSGTSIVLAAPCNSGDIVEVQSLSSLNVYNTITYDAFNGTGTTTAYTMSVSPANAASVEVTISGVTQSPSTYTVSGTTLTFTAAPPAGTNNVVFRYLGLATVGSVSSFSGGTTGLTPATATTGAITLGGTLAVANGGTGLTSVGTSGQALVSNGSAIVWGSAGASAGGVLYENSTTISSNYTLTSGKNAMMVGPLTVATGVTLTVPSGQRLVVL